MKVQRWNISEKGGVLAWGEAIFSEKKWTNWGEHLGGTKGVERTGKDKARTESRCKKGKDENKEGGVNWTAGGKSRRWGGKRGDFSFPIC